MAIPELLELLDVHGALVPIDVMGCQKAVAQKIVEQGGDYILSVKRQPTELARRYSNGLQRGFRNELRKRPSRPVRNARDA